MRFVETCRALLYRSFSLGAILKGIEIPYHRGLHRFAVFTACATLVLIVAGALVTSNDAGLSVPDWPTTFGSFYKMPHMVGGSKVRTWPSHGGGIHRTAHHHPGGLDLASRKAPLAAPSRPGRARDRDHARHSRRTDRLILSARAYLQRARRRGADLLLHRRRDRRFHRPPLG